MAEASDSISKVLDALSKVAWPLLAVFVVWKLYPVLSGIIQSRAFTIKVSDMEISVQEASNQLGEQIQDLQDKVAALEMESRSIPTQPMASGLTILWVDDHPANNAYQIAKLRDDGATVLTATSTEEAMEVLARQSVSAIISDMGRQEAGRFNQTAGLDLLRRVRKARIDAPMYFYSTSQTLKRLAVDIAAAGAEATSSPVDLLRLLRTGTAHVP